MLNLSEQRWRIYSLLEDNKVLTENCRAKCLGIHQAIFPSTSCDNISLQGRLSVPRSVAAASLCNRSATDLHLEQICKDLQQRYLCSNGRIINSCSRRMRSLLQQEGGARRRKCVRKYVDLIQQMNFFGRLRGKQNLAWRNIFCLRILATKSWWYEDFKLSWIQVFGDKSFGSRLNWIFLSVSSELEEPIDCPWETKLKLSRSPLIRILFLIEKELIDCSVFPNKTNKL